MNYFTLPEIEKILSSKTIRGKHKIWVRSIYSFGLSVQEMVSIRVKDVDFQKKTIQIPESKNLKTRTMFLPRNLLSDLRSGTCGKSPEDFLFQGRNGKLHSRTVLKALEKIREKTNLEISIRKLKKSLILHLHELGWDTKMIASYLGHLHARTTKRHISLSRPAPDIEHPIDKLKIL